ncbi:Threonine/homoserine efflux transporter RhtA [Poseidonocella pacifica]|uniref:Threonine/homoserine efflux transporter RhtA n=1 Tax=Poseidonocella pacifica TaxID=871651 RepID=A0A1I0XBT0_9RHOB|nr:DMT family transporter [Poseidonocella pacifica]SFA97876.1 Threonine/homoserine efflux transporter RhtA [Poseidonocella pacifica]
MRLFLLTALAMVAFAANSVLNRMALEGGETGPASFAAIRLASGAAMLCALLYVRGSPRRMPVSSAGAVSLAVYVLGFSFAYVTLDAGVGALLLFGGVQITMFAGAVLSREAIPLARWAGAALAFAGLVWLMWPGGAAAPSVAGAALMAAAAVGWGVYSLLGRGARDPLRSTAINFALATPLGLLIAFVMHDGIDCSGAVLAVLSGTLTSGLGYALWYSVLPRLPAAVAAIAQLTVPVIAVAGGAVLLAEPVTARLIVAGMLVLSGVALGVLGPGLMSPKVRSDRS